MRVDWGTTDALWSADTRRWGMEERSDSVHVPVLASEVCSAFAAGLGDDPEGLLIDGTVGAGGHAALLLERFGRLQLLGLDQDPDILGVARANLARFRDRVRLEHLRMSELTRWIRKRRLEAPIGMLMDLGASSLQLDRPERGFSFLNDGPLDMRMDPSRARTAADIVNTWDESDLADLFYYEGGEHRARPIARAIVDSRQRVIFRRTGALADLIARTVGRRGARIHPATKAFQALRRAVNEEGEELRGGLAAAEQWLADGGVLCAIAFHSGEDVEVKRFLQEGASEGRWSVATRKPIRPEHAEERSNPRARSARLRVAVRTRCLEEPSRARAREHRPLTGDGEGGGV